MKIGNFKIGGDSRTFIIAEISANHGHNIDIARQTILAAKHAGANGVKIQTYTADTLTIDCDNQYFKINSGTIWDGRSLYDLYQEAYTPWEWHRELFDYCNELGIEFFSTPFDKSATDFLDKLGVPAFKVASFEILDIPLIEYIASKGKPILISTGIASLSDIEEAVSACRRNGNDQIALLKCTSNYPAKIRDANLLTIPNMGETFDVEVGLSDHTQSHIPPVVAVTLGAKIIEKHFILDRSLGGPDASFSAEPAEFSQMVSAIRDAESSLGVIDYQLNDDKIKNRLLGRSLFIVEDVKQGDLFSADNVRSIRPGYGISPKYINQIVGKHAKGDYVRGTPFVLSMMPD